MGNGRKMVDWWRLTSIGLAVVLITSWISIGFFGELKAPAFQTFATKLSMMRAVPSDAGTLIMLPRRDGFNNQMETIYEDMNCALQSNPIVVMPHMLENMLSSDAALHGPFPFEEYYDLAFLKQHIRAVKPEDYFERCRRVLVNCHEDESAFKNRRVVVNDRREPSVLLLDYYKQTFGVDFQCSKDIVYADHNLEDSPFDCVANLTLKFQCERTLTPHKQEEWYVDQQDDFANIFRMLKPSAKVKEVTAKFQEFLPDQFSCMHYRGADFSKSAKALDNKEVLKVLERIAPEFLYVMCPPEDVPMLRELLKKQDYLPNIAFFEDYAMPIWKHFDWAPSRNDICMMMEELACADADVFMYTPLSTVSQNVVNKRMLHGRSRISNVPLADLKR